MTMAGKKHSDETRKKMSLARQIRKELLGFLVAPETREKLRQIALENGTGKWMKGRSPNEATREKMRLSAPRGIEHHNWKVTPSYSAIHYWLCRHYGNAIMCESKNCKKKSKTYEWAKLREKEYNRVRENFVQLCKSCHTSYDQWGASIL